MPRKSKEADKAYQKKWYEQNKEKQAQRAKEYREQNKEVIRERKRQQAVKYKYGVTWQEYQQVISTGCLVCGSNVNLHLDHCHETGKVRGCLCFNCNISLGYMKESPVLIERLAEYIRNYG